MKILPVLDLMAGQIVRGIAGRRRAQYRPIVSKLVDSAEPLAVARAFREHFGFGELYLADLDAIEGGQPATAVYESLHQAGFRLWIDAGVSSTLGPGLVASCVNSIVIGLESVLGPEALAQIVGQTDKRRLVFSLDLKQGCALGHAAAWKTNAPWPIAAQAVEIGIERLIVLDLGHVGVGAGVGTEDLCARLKQAYPEVQLTAGGGVRGSDDVKRLTALGVDRVLVASALHDGRITPADL